MTVVSVQDDHLVVEGPLNKDSVMYALAQAKALLTPEIKKVRFEKGRNCDSTSLAFIISLLKYAHERHIALKFSKLTKTMQHLFKISNLSESLLELDTHAS